MKILYRTLGLFLLVACFLISCSTLTEGVVVDKGHEDARYTSSVMFIKSGNVNVPITIYHYDDEDWFLVIEGTNEDGEIVQDFVYVTEETYNETNIGDHYVVMETDSGYDSNERIQYNEIPEDAEVE